MDKSMFEQKRKSHIEKGEIYFWTATINQWQRLLENNEYKDVIIDSLQHLTDTGKIDVFAFIIIPNHIHLIWRVKEANGNESPQGSFLKYTAHIFKKMLQREGELEESVESFLHNPQQKRSALRSHERFYCFL